MSTTTWTLDRDDIIAAALRKIGVLAKGTSPDSDDLDYGTTALNGIIARFNTLGMPLWKRESELIPIVSGTDTYTLTNAIKVTEVYLEAINSSTQYRIQPKSAYDITNLPYSTTGIPVSWAYTPNKTDGGDLQIWPIPDDGAESDYQLLAIKQNEFTSFDDAADEPDFPAYWYDAIIYALAVSLAPEKGVPLQDRIQLKQEADKYLDQAQGYGDEDGSLFIQPGKR